MSTLTKIFSDDPLGHTKEDIQLIVQKLRDQRKQFNEGAKQAGNMKPKAAPKTATGKAAAELAGQLSLKDLGL